MPEEIKKYKTKYNTEHSNMEDAIDYELVMDVTNDISKALGWYSEHRSKQRIYVDSRSKQQNGVIKRILENRKAVINSLKAVPPSFTIEKFDKHIQSDSYLR